MRKTITIFGSSLPVKGEKEYEDAYLLGALLAKKGFNICNGGNSGIMEATAKGAVDNGAKAIGVSIAHFGSSSNKYLTELVICKNLFERITRLIDSGDAFVILPGGTGTLLELAAVWELMNKDLIQTKPVACHSSMWQNLVGIMETRIKLEKRQTGLIKCFNSIEEITEYLASQLFSALQP